MTCPVCGSQAVVKTRLGRVQCSTCGAILLDVPRCSVCGHAMSVVAVGSVCGRCAGKRKAI